MGKTRKTTTTTETTKPTTDLLVAKEIALIATYGDRIVPGSIRRETGGHHAGKNTVEIGCEAIGCTVTRRVATSDVFQVTRCSDCTKAHRAEARKAKAAAKKAVPVKKTRKTRKTSK